jgi:putative DNA primase/helicase
MNTLRKPLTLRERITRYVNAVPPAISGQGGHARTFKLAIALVQGFDLSPEVALQFLEVYNRRCEPAWSRAELKHKLADADSATPNNGQPRGYLI